MANKHQINFPIWQYLNQPLFSSTTKLVLNPSRFWFLYRVQLLERCLNKAYSSEDYRR